MPSRSVWLLCLLLLHVNGKEFVSPECWIKLFQFIDQSDYERLPKNSFSIPDIESSTLDIGHLRFYKFFGKEISIDALSTYLSSLKGMSEDLPIYLHLLKGCQFDKTNCQFNAAIEKVLLRSSATGCFIIGQLNLVSEYVDQIVTLLSAENDSSRLVALEALKQANTLPSAISSRLIKCYNGMVLKIFSYLII